MTEFISGSDSGQYMVEFALAFVLFIFFIILVLDLAVLVYNHNLYHHALTRGSRTGALGASNGEIIEKINETLSGSYLPSIFFDARPDSVEITPSREILRVDGREVKLRMDVVYGLGFLWFEQLTVTLPVSSGRLVVQRNDPDRDGCKDALAGADTACESYSDFSSTYEKDHDNNGVKDAYLFGGTDADADGDGIAWHEDTVAIGYTDGSEGTCSQGYYLYRPHDPALGSTCEFGGITGWDEGLPSEGEYHAPEIWDDQTEASPRMFPRKLPRWGVDNSSRSHVILELRTDHDKVNNGWVDKYDDHPNEVDQW